MYESLTRFIPLLREGYRGEWTADRENDGAPHVRYGENVHRFAAAMTEFLNSGVFGKERFDYDRILRENSRVWRVESLADVDAPSAGKTVVAMIEAILASEPFCEGTILRFLQSGVLVRWLEKLREIDGKCGGRRRSA